MGRFLVVVFATLVVCGSVPAASAPAASAPDSRAPAAKPKPFKWLFKITKAEGKSTFIWTGTSKPKLKGKGKVTFAIKRGLEELELLFDGFLVQPSVGPLGGTVNHRVSGDWTVNAAWAKDKYDPSDPGSCKAAEKLDGGVTLAFLKEGKKVAVHWGFPLPINLKACRSVFPDGLDLSDLAELGKLTEVVELARLAAKKVSLRTAGSAKIIEEGYSTHVSWNVRIELARVR